MQRLDAIGLAQRLDAEVGHRGWANDGHRLDDAKVGHRVWTQMLDEEFGHRGWT